MAGYPVVLKNFTIVNVMGTANVGFKIDLLSLAHDHPDEINYVMDRPPGCAVYQFNDSLQGRIHHTGGVSD